MANFQVPVATTQAQGIFPSDIIIRTAIIEAIADMRRNPWLLDYVFAYLSQDPLTQNVYGQKEGDRAKEWFLKNNISVMMVPIMNEMKMPCISISLKESAEAEVTTGDTHYAPQELDTLTWPDLAGPFNPVGYDPATGIVTLDSNDLVIAPGMLVVTAAGNSYPITFVQGNTVFTTSQYITEDLNGMTVRGVQPSGITTLESVFYRESYQIGCHVAGEPVYLTWLHTILVFILLRYKQQLFEARGFESGVFNSAAFDRNPNDAENYFSRYITLTGKVRQYWPKYFTQRIQQVPVGIEVLSNSDEPFDNEAGWNVVLDVPNPPAPKPPPIPNGNEPS